ncbi:glycerophosphodiester phosphodiesterase [Micromonospora endophytica]|uniref:glycerophosphodiester phosphodiesterase n=1 Tax=Micromonospora endophytica TaxID=515350 RepID=A0A2W2CA09_9ACTN|nr:glycerophosphodiester phosphodiesterase [Micromonospora endophytica]PZF96265.1 glycerophosphodiester phosphodiesterase [Micromonospora endophytica]RIW43120.1 glycerophosphodiester phosphodiesterase [Micromonospora endophytica]BCJ60080.1 glycerophosphoryl diester phosphodiesterase [Micromonospora endophytica]
MRRRTLSALGVSAVLLAAVAVPGLAVAAKPAPGPDPARADHQPVVIGHRGASGYRPEHTIEAYRLAIRMGADYIEPDLVATADGVLVARHENEISGTTDVATRPEFADRRTTKSIDGSSVTGWFTEDFTLAELRTLRAKERLPQVRVGNTAFDGQYQVPTFQEVIDLARAEGKARGRVIGVYPETKHPSYFVSIGLPLEEPLVEVLRRNGWTRRSAPVIIQSFETANLRRLDRMIDVRLAQLLDASGRPYDFTVSGDSRTYRDLATPAGLKWIARYADGIGANKNLIVPRDSAGRLLAPTTLVRDAHREKLIVHAWTFRAENQFLPVDLRIGTDPNARGDIQAEYELFYRLGLDGVFTDHPDTAVAARAGLPRR